MTNKSQALRFTGWYLLLAGSWIVAFHVLPALSHSSAVVGFPAAHLALAILVAVTAALLYLAIRIRIAAPENEMPGMPRFPDRLGRLLLLIFAVFSTVIFSGGLSIYEVLSASIKQERAREMASVANLKEGMVTAWLQERQHDATLFGHDYDVAQHYARWLAHQESPQDIAALRSHLESIRKVYGYMNVSLLDTRGDHPYHADPDHARPGGGTSALVRQVVQSGEPAISPFYRDSIDDDIHFDILAPMLSGHGEGQRLVGVIVLHASAKQMLFPLIQVWPTETRTAETLLVRKEGDKVVFLNPLRHIANRPLEFTKPLAGSKLIAAMALRGEMDVREGVDYRGVPVLAAIRNIPGTDWIMVAKIDQEEIYGKLAAQRWLLGLFALLLVGTSGITLRLYWRQQAHSWLEQRYREQAERQALRSHYETILEHANDIFMLADADGRIVDANERTVEMTGYSRDELLAMNARQLISPLAREDMERQWQFSEHGAIYETELMRKDGSTFPVEVSARMIEVEGTIFRQSIIRGISERKQTEEAIRNSRDLLRSVVEHTPARVFWKDSNLRYLGCNTAFAQDAGLSHPQQLYGKDDFQMGWREQAELYRADDRRVMDSGVPKLGFEEPQTTPDGHTIWLRTSKVPLRDAEGRVSGVLGIYEDISDRKHGEQILQDEKTFSESLIQSLPAIFYLLDPQGGLIKWNRNLMELRGYTAEQMASASALDFIYEEDRPLIAQNIQQVFETGAATAEARLVTQNGIRLYALNGYRIETLHGLSIIGIGIDITDRKQAEDKLRESEAFTKAVLDNLPVGIAVNSVDPSVTFHYMNDNFPAIYRTSRDKLADPAHSGRRFTRTRNSGSRSGCGCLMTARAGMSGACIGTTYRSPEAGKRLPSSPPEIFRCLTRGW
ncbi:MAG: PAS domain S-box protein [Gammaproteobacteria bacterium]|nr:PAS domain S-box protein [Gammaproteobacteria bacterium]